MLVALSQIFEDASLLVTYNGRTFDLPLMETRWAFHRTAAPTDDLPHFDMLPPARRLWGRRGLRGDNEASDTSETMSCSLSALERSVLGFHRMGDVPGFEIPARYFHFLRTGDGAAVMGVLDHNRHDLLSLAGVMARALQLAEDGPDGCRDEAERLALGRVYERAGDRVRAFASFDMAARGLDRDVRRHALARLATMFARDDRHDEAAAAWRGVLDLARPRASLSALDRRAVEALAIHHEHRARDLSSARQFAEQLNAAASGRARQHAAHRLGRIDRKLQGRGKLL
jgi:tetratricopeptide (TPR) repeat protein